tara:strand:+ start:2372 stop:3118 length:747 start_codon:yes stop_codon:yes gene_type:complete
LSNPDLPICLITDQSFESIHFDIIEQVKWTAHPQKLKIEGMLRSPFKQTLYIDCDSICAGNIESIFNRLDSKSIVYTHVHDVDWLGEGKFRWKSYSRPFPQGGFLCYQSDECARAFISAWKARFDAIPDSSVFPGGDFGDQKQMKIVCADFLASNPEQLAHVPNFIWNARPWNWGQLLRDDHFQKVRVFHSYIFSKSRFMNHLFRWDTAMQWLPTPLYSSLLQPITKHLLLRQVKKLMLIQLRKLEVY